MGDPFDVQVVKRSMKMLTKAALKTDQWYASLPPAIFLPQIQPSNLLFCFEAQL